MPEQSRPADKMTHQTPASAGLERHASAGHSPLHVLPPTREAHQREEAHCAACPKLCRHTCPVADAEKRETVTPWGLMNALHFEGRDEPASYDSAEVDELVYHCTSCRACQSFCHFHQDVPGALHARRGEAYARSGAPESTRRLTERFYARGNNLYAPHLLEQVMQRVPAHRLKPDAREVIWVDCVTVARYPELISDLVAILDRLDRPDVGFYVDEPGCCGLPLYDAGDLEGFRGHAERVQRALARHKRVYQLSPGCTIALRDVYAQLDLAAGPEYRSFWDLLQSKLQALTYAQKASQKETDGVTLRPASESQARWVYLPPCQLDAAMEYPGLAEGWLRLMGAESWRVARDVGAQTPCSGGGGCLPALLPDIAKSVTQRCVAQFAPEANETVVVGCSSSQRRLSGQITGQGGSPVVSLVHLIANFLRQLEP